MFSGWSLSKTATAKHMALWVEVFIKKKKMHACYSSISVTVITVTNSRSESTKTKH